MFAVFFAHNFSPKVRQGEEEMSKINLDPGLSFLDGSFSVGNDFPGKVFHYLPKNFPRKKKNFPRKNFRREIGLSGLLK
jgi:hypothetical protein